MSKMTFFVQVTLVFLIRKMQATCGLIRNQIAGSGVDRAPNHTSYTEGSQPPWRMRES